MFELQIGVQLGKAHGPLHDEQQATGNARRARDSPSRQRRRAGRTAARDADDAQKVGAEKVQNEKTENTQNFHWTDGGTCSLVCPRLTLRSAPHWHQHNFFGSLNQI